MSLICSELHMQYSTQRAGSEMVYLVHTAWLAVGQVKYQSCLLYKQGYSLGEDYIIITYSKPSLMNTTMTFRGLLLPQSTNWFF